MNVTFTFPDGVTKKYSGITEDSKFRGLRINGSRPTRADIEGHNVPDAFIIAVEMVLKPGGRALVHTRD